MDREAVIRLAVNAGFTFVDDGCGGVWMYVNKYRPEPELPTLERFADLVASAVKEEDARICDVERAEFMAKASENNGRESDFAFGSVNSAERIAAAIRASIKEVK